MKATMQRALKIAATALILCSTSVFATERELPLPTDLAPIQVGVKSPPLWLFSKGNKRIIVLGTQRPLPKSGVLITKSIQEYIASSDAVLTGPGLRSGDGVGFFQGLTLASSMRKAKHNEGGQTLEQLVSPDVYRSWKALKGKYLGQDSGVEKLRPMYAAYELYKAALKSNNLTDDSMLGPLIADATADAGLERVDARYSLPNKGLRQTLKSFDVPMADDVGCFERTLATLEAYLEYSPSAAEAWAVGDMARFRLADAQYAPVDKCWERLTNVAMARSAGVADPYAQVDSTWLNEIQKALHAHDVVFTTLPVRDLARGNGFAARLTGQGFTQTALFTE